MRSPAQAAGFAVPGTDPGQRRRALGGGFLLLVAMAPSAAGQGARPSRFWGVEFLDTWQYGIGVDLRFDGVDDLETAALASVVRLRDSRTGEEVVTVIPGDPALNDRKFDLEWEETDAGVQVPLGLPPVRLGREVDLRTAVVLELGVADLRLDFRDRTVPGDSTALEGRGPRFGIGLEAVAPLCRDCRFFAGAGYRYRLLPDLDIDRRGEVAPPGQPVPGDRVTLSHDRHSFSARLGRAGRRFTPYLGARARWSEIEIDDAIRFASPDGVETAVTTRTVLERDAVAALAGLDARLSPHLLGRIEATFGDGGEAVLLKAVYLASRPPDGARVRRLSRGGPRVTHGPNLVEIEGLVAGGWPVAVEYRLEEPGAVRLTVEVDGDGVAETYDLPAEPGALASEIVHLPADLGDRLRAGLLRIQALNEAGEAVPFEFLGVGAGEGAVGSLAVRPIVFAPPSVSLSTGEPSLSYCFASHTRFDDYDVEVFRRQVDERDGEPVHRLTSAAVLAPRRDCRAADSVECRAAAAATGIRCWEGRWDWSAPNRPSPGWHLLQVRAWRGLRRTGHWLVGVSPGGVEVVP